MKDWRDVPSSPTYLGVIPSSSAPCRPSYFPYYSIAWAHASKMPHCLIVPSIAQNTQCISVGLMLKYLHYFMLMWGSDSNWSPVGLPHFWAFLIFMRGFKQAHCISKGDQHNIQAVMKLMPSMIEQSSIGTTKKLIQPLYSRRHTSTPWANPKIDHISKFTTLCYPSYICIYIRDAQSLNYFTSRKLLEVSVSIKAFTTWHLNLSPSMKYTFLSSLALTWPWWHPRFAKISSFFLYIAHLLVVFLLLR